MFCSLEYRDAIIVFRGLLILVVVIILGVSVSERQINSLTQRQDGVRVFSMNCDHRSVYSIYILGSSYNMSAVYSVGEIINNDKAIIIKTSHHHIVIPTYIEIDCKKAFILLDLWAKLLVDKGFDFKQSLELYLTGLPQRLNDYIEHFR
ncbi:MAG: hypothetical protein H6Q68_1089 [Firmicutes bacterium]|nr:hypothetical protein [Bacillota bacterium]